MGSKTILSLCDYSGVWSEPYKEAGYNVIRVDLQLDGSDLRLLKKIDSSIHGIIAQPPCDHFAVSGARWWAEKGHDALLSGLSIVDACLRAVTIYQPRWWVLENPVGRLKHYLGPPKMIFDPCVYAGFADDHESEQYTKATCLWGDFNANLPQDYRGCKLGSKMHLLGSKQKNERSRTPQGFARAFFQANQ